MNKNKELLYAIILTVFPIVLFFIPNIPECEYFLIELFKITNHKTPLEYFYLIGFAIEICGMFLWGKIIINTLHRLLNRKGSCCILKKRHNEGVPPHEKQRPESEEQKRFRVPQPADQVRRKEGHGDNSFRTISAPSHNPSQSRPSSALSSFSLNGIACLIPCSA